MSDQAAKIGGTPAHCPPPIPRPPPTPPPHTKQRVPYKTATLDPTFNGDNNKDLKEEQHGRQNEGELRPGFMAAWPLEGTS